jgi:hypothetical protein
MWSYREKGKLMINKCPTCGSTATIDDGSACAKCGCDRDANERLALTAGSPSFAARYRLGQDTVELRVPTGDDDTPYCWHGLDLATAKRLRNEMCAAVDTLEAILDLRKFNAENSELSQPKP